MCSFLAQEMKGQHDTDMSQTTEHCAGKATPLLEMKTKECQGRDIIRYDKAALHISNQPYQAPGSSLEVHVPNAERFMPPFQTLLSTTFVTFYQKIYFDHALTLS